MNTPDISRLELFMANYVQPQHSPRQVNHAGDALRDFVNSESGITDEIRAAIAIVDNFRAAHQFPLNTFYMTLRNRSSRIFAKSLISQRTKRFPSIIQKLLDRPTMNLTQMQDIGGCRAVLHSIEQVYELRDSYLHRRLVHPFAGILKADEKDIPEGGEKDYILEPKPSGYRSLHLKFRFDGRNRSPDYNGLRIEIQIRTELQHKWATAVEAAQIFSDEALKSNKGSPQWLRFFALVGSIFAQREGMPAVPGTEEADLIEEIRQLNREHYMVSAFEAYRTLVPRFEKSRNAKYFLLVLDPQKPEVLVKGFGAKELQKANTEYADMERYYGKDSPVQVVLVSVAKISDLIRAYPSFFLDTEDFLREVKEIVGA